MTRMFLTPALPAVNRFVALVATSGATYALASVVAPFVLGTLTRKVTRMASSRTLFASLLALVLVGGTAAADDLSSDLDALITKDGLTADQAASRSRAASPDVARKAAELDAAMAQVSAAKIAWLPQLSTKFGYTRLSDIDEPMLAPGLELKSLDNSYVSTSQIVLPVSDYVLRLPSTTKAARLGEYAARAGKRATELDAATEARIAYYEWMRARLQVLVAQRQLAQVRTTLDQVKKLVAGDRLSRADLLRVESQEAEAEQALDQLRTLATLREERLRLQIGARTDEQLAIGEDVREPLTMTSGAPNLDDAMQAASKKRMDLKAVSLAIEANEAQRRAEKANLLPRLSAFAQTEYANPNQRVFPQNDEFTFTWSAGAQLSFSLSDALISRTTNRRMQAESNALRADREALTLATRLQVLSAQQNIANAQKAIETSRKRLVAAEESYRVRKAFLEAERGTAVELVDAETNLTSARISALDARVDLRIAKAELDHALGNDASGIH